MPIPSQPRRRVPAPFAAVAAASLALAGPLASQATAQGTAQGTPAGNGRFVLELNKVEDIGEICRLTYVAENRTGVALEATAYNVVMFDAVGTVTSLLILEFGRLPDGKTKVVQFDIAGGGCAGISRLLINDVDKCETVEGAVTACLDALVTTSRVDSIAFGA